MTINRRVAGKLLAGSTLAFTAGAARAQSSDDLIAAAKREGKVVVYSAYVSPVTNEPIAKAFEKKYGVSVETFMARGPELRERIRVEQMTGHLLGDVQHNAITTTTIGINQDGNVQPHGNLSGVARLKPEFAARSDDLQIPIFTINYGILVNANLVKPEDEPKSWNDLLNPKWKGRILLDDPRATGGGRVMFHMTMDRFGRAFHDALARQEPVFSRDYGEAGRRLARGEFALYAPLLFSQVGTLKGLPIRAIVPAEGVVYGSYSVSILKGAAHPNAARLFADFYFSDEAQGIYANTGHGVVIRELKAAITPDMKPFAGVTPMIAEDSTRIEQYLALAREIYK